MSVRGPHRHVGRRILELLGTDAPEHPSNRGHAAALTGEAARFIDHCRGRVFNVHMEPLRDPRGDVVGSIGVGLDITDGLETEQRNTHLHRQLEFAQRIARIGSWEFDLATGESLWSDEGYRLLGWEPGSGEITFERFLAAVHPDDRARVRNLRVEGLQAGGGLVGVTYRLVRPDGEIRQMRGVVELVAGDHGRVTRTVGVLRDVTPSDAPRAYLPEHLRR
jgi:PAS domain-containing protein